VPSLSPQIVVDSLACSRGDRQLFRDVSFSLSAGSAIHLEGANGSGKTTLLRTIAGMTQADGGDISWCGQPIRDAGDEYRQQVAYVGHLNGLQPELNILENLRYATGLSGYRANPEKMASMIEQLGLTSRIHLPTKLLSQGQKRRAALCRLGITDQSLWLLDEPLTALDDASIEVLLQMFDRHLTGGGLIIYTSHQPLGLTGNVTRLRLGT